MDQPVTQMPSLQIPGYRHIQDSQRIVWLAGSGNYTLLYLKDTHYPLMVSQTLKYFEHHLPGFIRVSKSSLVNPIYVRKIVRMDAKVMHLELMDGVTIIISRRRILDTLDRLEATSSLLVRPRPTLQHVNLG